jgi:membrane protease subunit (stomatin/prohibitin family)
LRDAEFGPIRIRAFGTYVVRITNALRFIQEIVGTDGHFTKDEITDQLRNLIVSRFADIIGESKIPILDLAANYDELGKFVTMKIGPEFRSYGLEVTKLLVENVSLPDAVEKAMDKRSSMGIMGDLSRYTQYQAATAMEEAAKNPDGMASGGMGMGMGFAMANQMGKAMQGGTAQGDVPPPLPAQSAVYHLAVEGQQRGPYDMETLGRFAKEGQLTKETLVWCKGMAQWTPAGEVPDLAKLFEDIPPPLPPQ